jgi:hypothetical protein
MLAARRKATEVAHRRRWIPKMTGLIALPTRPVPR